MNSHKFFSVLKLVLAQKKDNRRGVVIEQLQVLKKLSGMKVHANCELKYCLAFLLACFLFNYFILFILLFNFS